MSIFLLHNILVHTSLRSFFKRTNPHHLRFFFKPPSREDLIFGGAVLLILLFLMVFVWGGYVFYATRQPMEQQSVLSVKVPSLTPEDFDEMAKLLDTRDQKFKDVLAE